MSKKEAYNFITFVESEVDPESSPTPEFAASGSENLRPDIASQSSK